MILSGYQYVFKFSQLCTVSFRNDLYFTLNGLKYFFKFKINKALKSIKKFFFQDGNIAWSLGIGFLILSYTEFNIENKTIGFADSVDLAVEFYFLNFMYKKFID